MRNYHNEFVDLHRFEIAVRRPDLEARSFGESPLNLMRMIDEAFAEWPFFRARHQLLHHSVGHDLKSRRQDRRACPREDVGHRVGGMIVNRD